MGPKPMTDLLLVVSHPRKELGHTLQKSKALQIEPHFSVKNDIEIQTYMRA
jgi:hypothetical protein